MSEESQAVRATAGAMGKAIDTARAAGAFIAKYVDGPLTEGIGIFHDRLKYMRWERQVRLMERADQFLKERGVESPTRAVPLKVAIPLLQAGSIEDDDLLQDKWARLLANAGDADSGVNVERSFVEILSQISPLEARILDALYAVDFHAARKSGVMTAKLPNEVVFRPETQEEREKIGFPPEPVMIALGNLSRLGCLKLMTTWGGGESYASITPTMLGKAFIEACSPPNA